METTFRPGDQVIYRKQKHSTRPGPRAEQIQPSRSGEAYTYQVDKYWMVKEVTADGSVVVRTRRGKEHLLDPADPRLSRARWWEKFLYRKRFPEPSATAEPS